jgi:hypothetical protein
MAQHEDPHERLERLLEDMTYTYRRRIESAIKQFQSDEQVDAIADLIAEGRDEEALLVAGRFASTVASGASIVYVTSAQQTARFLERVTGLVIDYNHEHVRATRYLQDNNFRLVQNLTGEQTAVLRAVLVQGNRSGQNPRVTARQMLDSLGLTPRQEAAVENYRRLLEQGSARALRLALHDKRTKNIKDLTPEQIDKLVARYRARYIRYRAEVVARTEALRAVHAGVVEMYDQAIESGVLPPQELQRKWFTARDSRVRGHHVSMHGQLRPVNKPFVSGQGNLLMYPGDPSAPASDVVQCRCVVTTRFRTRN